MLVVAVLIITQYTDAKVAILMCIGIVLSFHKQLGTNVMNIFSLSHTMKIMIIQNIFIVIFVKQKEAPIIGFIIVQFVTLQLISTVLLEIIHF